MITVMNLQEASNYLSKTRASLRNGYKKWGIPYFYLGGSVRFTQEALDSWIDAGIKNPQKRTLKTASEAE